MADIQHNLTDDEEATIRLDQQIGYPPHLEFSGNGSDIRVYLDHDQLELLANKLYELGYVGKTINQQAIEEQVVLWQTDQVDAVAAICHIQQIIQG